MYHDAVGFELSKFEIRERFLVESLEDFVCARLVDALGSSKATHEVALSSLDTQIAARAL